MRKRDAEMKKLIILLLVPILLSCSCYGSIGYTHKHGYISIVAPMQHTSYQYYTVVYTDSVKVYKVQVNQYKLKSMLLTLQSNGYKIIGVH